MNILYLSGIGFKTAGELKKKKHADLGLLKVK